MITHISSRQVTGDIAQTQKEFDVLGPDQIVVEPLTQRCAYLIREAAHHCDYIEIQNYRYMVNRIEEVHDEDDYIRMRVKLQKVDT